MRVKQNLETPITIEYADDDSVLREQEMLSSKVNAIYISLYIIFCISDGSSPSGHIGAEELFKKSLFLTE